MNEFTVVNKIIGLFGKRNSGKSRLLRYLVENEKDEFKKIFVICPTECINNFYKKLVDEECIFDTYDNDWMLQLIKKMTDAKQQSQKTNNILIILDDCISDTDFHHCQSLNILCTRGRHLNIAVILTSQYIFSIPPVCRNNLDYVFCGQMNKKSVDLLSDEFLLGDVDKHEFIKLYNNSTKDYNFLAINCNSVKDNDDINQIYGTIKTPIEYL